VLRAQALSLAPATPADTSLVLARLHSVGESDPPLNPGRFTTLWVDHH
jgi:hypothetical protein